MDRHVALLLASALVGACGAEAPPTAAPPATPAAAPAAAAPAQPTGPVKVVDAPAPGDEDRYALAIDPPATAAPGQEAKVTVRVVPKAPWHMNLDFPTSLKVQPPAGVTLAKADLKRADAARLDDGGCEFSVAFTPSEAGEKAFSGEFKFAVCQDEACSPVTEKVEFKVAVN